ncbi:hypothetical protein B0J12DRAFT_670539 [Macrophomina phaseolina]|uniref:Uncharacterized protein n=1 Tax=Macrophomina phaseolina TaxID=35725 RepID=A0ABQ8G4C6_9PEZI|nr:hypothetical protein B0J12DRAFT_670539 [Macrophomina phaseolina]
MHKIYAIAEVTLVAAAGKSPDHGLPGVSEPRRKPPQVSFGSSYAGRNSTRRSASYLFVDMVDPGMDLPRSPLVAQETRVNRSANI